MRAVQDNEIVNIHDVDRWWVRSYRLAICHNSYRFPCLIHRERVLEQKWYCYFVFSMLLEILRQ